MQYAKTLSAAISASAEATVAEQDLSQSKISHASCSDSKVASPRGSRTRCWQQHAVDRFAVSDCVLLWACRWSCISINSPPFLVHIEGCFRTTPQQQELLQSRCFASCVAEQGHDCPISYERSSFSFFEVKSFALYPAAGYEKGQPAAQRV